MSWLTEPRYRILEVLLGDSDNLRVVSTPTFRIAHGAKTMEGEPWWDRDRIVIVSEAVVTMRWMRENQDHPDIHTIETAIAFNEEANLCWKYGHARSHFPLGSLSLDLEGLIEHHRETGFKGGDMYLLGFKESDAENVRMYR